MYPPISPILFQLGPLAVHWYGITMTTAILVGASVASAYVSRHGRDGNTIWDMFLWILVPALIGARLYFVFIQSPRGPQGLGDYLAHPIKIVQIWNGGIHIYGAFLLGGLALLLYLKIRKLPFLLYFDAIGLGLLIGQAIGRIGNFINQELYGPPTTLPWGLHIDAQHRIAPYNNLTAYPDNVRFQPLFLYEMLWDAIGFFFLLLVLRRFGKHLRDGDVFLMFLIWSPLGRFFIEFLRTDSWFFPGTHFDLVHILTAFAVIVASIILYLRHRPKTRMTSAIGSGNTGAPAVPPAISGGEDELQKDVVTQDTTAPDTLGIEGQA